MTGRAARLVVATVIALGISVPASAGELITLRFDLPTAPLGIFGVEFTQDFLVPVEDVVDGEIVSTRFHLEYDSTVEPNSLADAANLAIQFQPPAGDLPVFTVSGADLGWSGMGQFTGDLETDALDLPILDFPPDTEFSLWFLRIVNLDDEVPFLGGQLSASYIDVDVEVPQGGATSFPITLEVDPVPAATANGNGIFEPGEVVDVAPSWHNDSTEPVTLSGTASEFGGPEGADYTLALDVAEYGLVEAGQTARCLDTGTCYLLGVSDPFIRPASHWDAAFTETLSDGAAHTWRLHVGGSFSDVAPESPFYRAVETLLHAGVTSGCGAEAFCPGTVATRAQVPVLLLKAVEGPDYVPPACEGDDLFVDVPSGSPFCPWIQDLASRRMTSGCSSGHYCPGAPVTRAQIAVLLLRMLKGFDYVPPKCDGRFADVPCPSTFASWIEDLAERGITSGCGAGSYCPTATVSRRQAAVFVTRTFGLTPYGP